MTVVRGPIDVTILDGFGQPVVGAKVQIQVRNTTTLPAVWQDDTTVVQLPNPTYADVYGRVPGWLNRGSYDLFISHPSIAPYVEPIEIAVAGDGTIDTAWLQDGCVTDAKLSGTLSSGSIGAGAIATVNLADGAVTDVKVNPSGISGTKIQAGTLPGTAIAAGGVTATQLASGAVTDVKVATGISGTKIATGTLPGAAIANASITQTQMAASSVGAAQIIDGSVGTAEIADGSITGAKLASQASVPTAVILPYGGTTAPSGFLMCDGSAYSRATYSALFGLIGTFYGAGDGSTTFNVPDGRGRDLVGVGTHADVNALGKNDGIAVASRRPRHAHTITDPGHSHGGSGQYVTTSGGTNGVFTGGGSSHDQIIPSNTIGISVGQAGMTDSGGWLAVNYIIKT